MTDVIYVARLKSGKWRLYKSEQRATTAWRGANEKRTVIREERVNEVNFNEVLSFGSKEAAVAYAELVMGVVEGDVCEV